MGTDCIRIKFPISRDPPEGGTSRDLYVRHCYLKFPISRDPPEGGTEQVFSIGAAEFEHVFPISRDPPEGGTPALHV